ncbi:hypothetical protein [Pseudomonas soli]|uniref:Uncharacterized protein n=1 Tax=Pseudomonas soli TaxID=1306993 RepID=A0AAJ5SSH7_9PSED|nr:hypothetical protein [Pseudomonas soli]UXZ44529.1 hypothetical protein K7K07_21015 [Pseudomonas soli]
MTEDACETAQQKTKSTDLFSTFLVVVVLVSVVAAVAFYRTSFDAGLSQSPDKWSAFGSYIGGVFGPLISFLTLLAILKTIGLQKDLLDTQRTEFEALHALQIKSNEAQLAQIKRSEDEAARRLIEESRISALQALNGYMDGVRSEYERKRSQFDVLYQWMIDGKAATSKEDVAAITEKLKLYEKKLALMMILYGDVCFGEFPTVENLKKTVNDGLADIWDPGEGPSFTDVK